jgi:hypothetical protein
VIRGLHRDIGRSGKDPEIRGRLWCPQWNGTLGQHGDADQPAAPRTREIADRRTVLRADLPPGQYDVSGDRG